MYHLTIISIHTIINIKNNTRSNKAIIENMQSLDLHDVWRIENEAIKTFTWRGPQNKMARLDYFIVSSDLQLYLKQSGIGLCHRSDHSPISITFSFNDQPRGRGVWKFNNSLLNDPEYVNIVKTTIQETIDQYKTEEHGENTRFSINDQLFWETLKLMIRGKTISYAS